MNIFTNSNELEMIHVHNFTSASTNWTDIMQKVENKTVDIGLGLFIITNDIFTNVEFAFPLLESPTGLFMRLSKKDIAISFWYFKVSANTKLNFLNLNKHFSFHSDIRQVRLDHHFFFIYIISYVDIFCVWKTI